MCVLFDSVFFFSSRRRHTRCSRDWSSDVCSSDLVASGSAEQRFPGPASQVARQMGIEGAPALDLPMASAGSLFGLAIAAGMSEIGRASCRERVRILVVVGSLRETGEYMYVVLI